MKRLLAFICLFLFNAICFAQDAWKISASNIELKNYYGVTVANGMIGIVSSPEAFKVKDVVLAGAYDLYGRGRVSNFIKSFNLLNMYMEIDGSRLKLFKKLLTLPLPYKSYAPASTTSFTLNASGLLTIPIMPLATVTP